MVFYYQDFSKEDQIWITSGHPQKQPVSAFYTVSPFGSIVTESLIHAVSKFTGHLLADGAIEELAHKDYMQV